MRGEDESLLESRHDRERLYGRLAEEGISEQNRITASALQLLR
jgi:hypothetical protein